MVKSTNNQDERRISDYCEENLKYAEEAFQKAQRLFDALFGNEAPEAIRDYEVKSPNIFSFIAETQERLININLLLEGINKKVGASN